MDSETLQRLKRGYIENQIALAHPVEVVGMLYDLTIASLEEAIGHLRTGDRMARSAAITRAELAVQELVAALDPSVDAQLTRNLASLYRFCLDRMVSGHANESEAALREALPVLRTLADGWRQVKQQICDAPKAAYEEPAPAVPAEPVFSGRYSMYQSPEPVTAGRDWSL